MNVQQKLVITFVTAGILVAIALAINFIDNEKMDKSMLKYVLAAVVMLVWFFFVFIADLYMKMGNLEEKVETYQKQFHKDIMKRYIEVEEKCGKKLI